MGALFNDGVMALAAILMWFAIDVRLFISWDLAVNADVTKFTNLLPKGGH